MICPSGTAVASCPRWWTFSRRHDSQRRDTHIGTDSHQTFGFLSRPLHTLLLHPALLFLCWWWIAAIMYVQYGVCSLRASFFLLASLEYTTHPLIIRVIRDHKKNKFSLVPVWKQLFRFKTYLFSDWMLWSWSHNRHISLSVWKTSQTAGKP